MKIEEAVSPPPSFTVSVIVAVPPFPFTGVTVTVREAPAPPKTIFATGTRVMLLDAPVNVSEATVVRSSPTVKDSADVDDPVLIVCAATVEIVGGAFTVRMKLVDAVNPPPSVTVMVMVAVPFSPLVGVTVTVRDPADPPKTICAVGTSVVLLDEQDTVNAVNAVRSSVRVKASADVAAFIFTCWLAMVEMVGGALTDNTKFDAFDNPPLSRTEIVMVVTPVFPATGVTVTVRVAPDPPKTILATGTSVKLLDAPVNVNEAAAVTSSPTEKESAEVDVLTLMTWAAMVEIVGGPFTVSVKLELAVNITLFVTVRVMVVVPLIPVAGVDVTVRDAPDPPNTIFVLGSKVVLLDAAVTTNEATGV